MKHSGRKNTSPRGQKDGAPHPSNETHTHMHTSCLQQPSRIRFPIPAEAHRCNPHHVTLSPLATHIATSTQPHPQHSVGAASMTAKDTNPTQSKLVMTLEANWGAQLHTTAFPSVLCVCMPIYSLAPVQKPARLRLNTYHTSLHTPRINSLPCGVGRTSSRAC